MRRSNYLVLLFTVVVLSSLIRADVYTNPTDCEDRGFAWFESGDSGKQCCGDDDSLVDVFDANDGQHCCFHRPFNDGEIPQYDYQFLCKGGEWHGCPMRGVGGNIIDDSIGYMTNPHYHYNATSINAIEYFCSNELFKDDAGADVSFDMWATRTQLLALKLLGQVPSNYIKYSLICDDESVTLNVIPSSNDLQAAVENVCVLTYYETEVSPGNENVFIGFLVEDNDDSNGIFNEMDILLDSLGYMDGTQCNDQIRGPADTGNNNDNDYDACNAELSFHDGLNITVYKIAPQTPSKFWGFIHRQLWQKIYDIVNVPESVFYDYNDIVWVIQDFNKLYIDSVKEDIGGVSKEKTIFAVYEKGKRDMDLLTVNYEGFDNDICQSFEAKTSYDVNCELSEKNQTVLKVEYAVLSDAFFDDWIEFTGKLRTQQDIFGPEIDVNVVPHEDVAGAIFNIEAIVTDPSGVEEASPAPTAVIVHESGSPSYAETLTNNAGFYMGAWNSMNDVAAGIYIVTVTAYDLKGNPGTGSTSLEITETIPSPSNECYVVGQPADPLDPCSLGYPIFSLSSPTDAHIAEVGYFHSAALCCPTTSASSLAFLTQQELYLAGGEAIASISGTIADHDDQHLGNDIRFQTKFYDQNHQITNCEISQTCAIGKKCVLTISNTINEGHVSRCCDGTHTDCFSDKLCCDLV